MAAADTAAEISESAAILFNNIFDVKNPDSWWVL